jgi:catechol 2,3-dioxygenase-like lactoylglutathione lyase family enzyme
VTVIGIDHVQIAAPPGCEAAARAFYGGLLGLPELPKPEPLASRGGCWFEAGELELHVGVEDPFAPARKAHPGFVVDDLEALRERLAREGIAVRDDTDLPGAVRFYADDPFGNRLEFRQL